MPLGFSSKHTQVDIPLMTMDIDQFFVGEDGALVLADDCGNITYCDKKRFKVVAESEEQDGD